MVRRFFVWSAILALFLDQVSKVLVYGLLREGGQQRVLGELVRFSRTRNPDGIFGLQFGPPFVYFVLPILGIILVLYFAVRGQDRWLGLCYGLVLGGAVGNLVDRVRLGHVIDFIDIGVKGWRWYTFNLADLSVIVGIVLLIARELFGPKPKPASDTPAPSCTTR